MLKVDIRGMDDVRRKLAGIQRDLQPKVLQPALNKVGDKARAEIAKAIPEEFAVKAAEVRSAVAMRRSSNGRLQVVIDIFGSAKKRGRSLNLIHFLAAYRALGQTFKARGAKVTKRELANLDRDLGFIIKRAGGLKKIEGAFVGNKGRTIFTREGKARLPIKPLQVIGFSQMFKSRRIERRVMDKVRAELPVEIDRALRMVMERGR